VTSRQTIFDLLAGKKIDSQPAFSGLIHITQAGLQREGLTLYEAHHDPQKMAKAGASTFRLTEMPSAALPLDLCAPAEALGATLNYYEYGNDRFPQPAKPLFASTKYLNQAYFESTDFLQKGRIPLICEAIRILKDDIGLEAVISGIIPGPYTLLLYLVEPGGLFAEMKRDPNSVMDALSHISSFLSQIGSMYRDSGADFITVHDMGGSPGFIGPAKYEQFAFPAQKLLLSKLLPPRVLSVCGNTNKSMHLLAQSGADAISVDQLNDLAESRKVLTHTLLFGNIDPVARLWQGDESGTKEAVLAAKEAGVDAVWPGCDLVLQTSLENLNAFVRAF
jgi:[methyl-Co(III) methanol-specific corrinoid protein]:coenzyme M methyltransferase